MTKEELLKTLEERAISLKKTNQDAVCGAIAGLMASGQTFDQALTFVKGFMASAFDAEGIKALELEKLIKAANAKLTEAFRVEASGILGNLDLASERADSLEAEYKTVKADWDNTPKGKELVSLGESVRIAQLAFEAKRTEYEASAEYKAVGDKLNVWSIATKAHENEIGNLSALVRKIAGEDNASALTLTETEDGKGITFAPSGRKRARKPSGASGTTGKGSPLTVVKDGVETVFSAAAQARKALLPDKNGSEMSRDAIIKALNKKGFTVKA